MIYVHESNITITEEVVEEASLTNPFSSVSHAYWVAEVDTHTLHKEGAVTRTGPRIVAARKAMDAMDALAALKQALATEGIEVR